MWRGSHTVESTPRAFGTHRAGFALFPRMVFQGTAQPHWPLTRYLAAAAPQVRQASESCRSFPKERKQTELDDFGCHSGYSAGVASSGAIGWRALRDLGLE